MYQWCFKHNTKIHNGLATYSDIGIDPNTTLESLILTNINTPNNSMMFIETTFSSDKSATANRSQIATPYDETTSTSYQRYYHAGAWSEWIMMLNTNSAADYPVEVGTSGIWTYRKWNSGIAECFGRLYVTQTSYSSFYVGPTAIWGLYLIPASEYPFKFLSVPIMSALVKASSGTGYVATFYEYLDKAQCVVACNFTSSIPITLHYNIVGKWK